MSTDKRQSAIEEVRDQISLDFADGKYLNIVSSNLGLTRPRVGFADDTWRAITRAIALSFKQIRFKFEEILAIVFGPKTTLGMALTQDAAVDDTSVFVSDPTDFPQLGELVFDEGQATEETVRYCYVDKFRNRVFLAAPLTQDHVAASQDFSLSVIAVDVVNGDKLIVSGVDFPAPSPFVPYTIVVGAGTAAEETAVVTAVNTERKELTLLAPLANVHEVATPSSIKSELSQDYNPTTNVLVVTDARQFPPQGNVLLGLSSNVYAATGGTADTATVAALTFTPDAHSGDIIVFADNTTTPLLQGEQAVVISNTGGILVLDRTLPAVVAAGDTFRFRPVVQYSSIDYTTNTLTLDKPISDVSLEENRLVHTDTVDPGPPAPSATAIPLVTGGLAANEHRGREVLINGELVVITSHDFPAPDDLLIVNPPLSIAPPAGAPVVIRTKTTVTVLERREAADMGQLKSPGTGWDVIQTDSHNVEVLIPDSLKDSTDVRSAAYLHTTRITPTPMTTLAAVTAPGDSEFVADAATVVDFPVVGVVTLEPAGVAENVAYYNPESFIAVDADEGDTTITVLNSQVFPSAGVIVLGVKEPAVGGPPPVTQLGQEIVTILSNDAFTNTLTLTAPLVNDHRVGEKVKDTRFIIPNDATISSALGVGIDVGLYQPWHGGTSLLDGNLWLFEDVFPGPYIYDASQAAPNMGLARTTLAELLPGPAVVAMDQVAARSAIEVNGATAFPLTGFPYIVEVGANAGNLEDVIVNDINLKQRTSTTTTGPAVGNLLPVAAVVDTAGVGISGANFPDDMSYRVLVDKAGVAEVVYVTGVSGLNLVLEEAPINVFGVGDTVELMADVLSVVATTDVHEGVVSQVFRSTKTSPTARFPSFSSTDQLSADSVSVPVSSILLGSVSGFPSTGAKLYLNFGNTAKRVESEVVALPALNIIEVPDASIFPPATPPAPVVVTIDPESVNEEVVRVSTIDFPGNKLILEADLRVAHAVGTLVTFEVAGELLLSYDSVVGNNLRFSPPIVLQSTHSPGESAIVSVVDSEPKDNGYDFPFFLPPDLSFRLAAILDLVRAAGVEVTFIDKR